MAGPFSSREHYAITPSRCFCGSEFSDLFRLDVHLYGPELAEQMRRDRDEALKAIHVKAAELAEGGE